MTGRWVVVCLALAACGKSTSAQVGLTCTKNADCPGQQCLALSDGRSVCSVECTTVATCPSGWTCGPLPTGGSPLCQCTPTAERCDGVDNDCDGIVDNNCGGGGGDAGTGGGADLAVPPATAVTKVDILIMMDDSPSITPVIQQLSARIAELIKALDDVGAHGRPASYHIGVITSDLGAAQSNASANCKPGGLGGKLQTPTTSRGHQANCTALQLGGGVNFIDYNQLTQTNNLPTGVDIVNTLNCMTAVGDIGCGFEMPLEAVYRALSGTVPENHDFLRPDAALAVLWVTNEDDCSAPDNTDLFDLNKTATYGAELSYRCTNYGIMCGVPPMLPPYAPSTGNLSECQGATAAVGGKLYEMSRYIDFFNTIKSNPRLVVLGAIAAPPLPVSIVMSNPQTGQSCTGSISTTCAVSLAHSCMSANNVSIFGDPAVRIDQLLRAMPNYIEGSVCSDDYTTTVTSFGQAIAALLGP